MTFTNEQIQKALKCKSVDELLELAKNEGVTITKEDAAEFMEQISGLSPDDLEMVAGGGKVDRTKKPDFSEFIKRVNDK